MVSVMVIAREHDVGMGRIGGREEVADEVYIYKCSHKEDIYYNTKNSKVLLVGINKYKYFHIP